MSHRLESAGLKIVDFDSSATLEIVQYFGRLKNLLKMAETDHLKKKQPSESAKKELELVAEWIGGNDIRWEYLGGGLYECIDAMLDDKLSRYVEELNPNLDIAFFEYLDPNMPVSSRLAEWLIYTLSVYMGKPQQLTQYPSKSESI
ncbi:hypothetical protein I7I51_09016 [Histoplasma capsulatum]|uniref:Uncharacterized protein n=1 Tax=Ajellomyces capsulatus TaxID=5037 RepID=A0A8A1M2K4_AJECA|nr:hypothetical protein I7I51_09016 [Histoplasma capsulatum]